MKTNRTKERKKGSKPKSRRRGVALITVLTIMSLATILIMTFFSLAQNEHSASTSYSAGLQAQQVAEQAVNLMIRQIRKATSNVGLESGQTLAWSSQPGAIRTWTMDGYFNAAYKLYSDDEMIETDEDALVQKDFSDLKDWDSKPWAFVDLNEPVIRGERVYYPIVDPIAKTVPEWPSDLGNDNNGIEGFDWNLEGISPGPMESVVTDRQRDVLPMPAMWIYQLKDGTLGFLNESQAFEPLKPGGETPEETNPIVARFAFWTDDETCKLNPNVHAGGASWATPMASGDIDRHLGRYQPAQHEWQRYPGHVATTHLAPVLAPGVTDITYQRDNMEMLFELVPRVVGGGSMSGTTSIDENDPSQRNGLIADKDRLYASLDEFIMKPDRTPNEFPTPGERGIKQTDEYMQEHIERSKFFLSVVSRSPEVTVFNTPRVSIWPTHYDLDSNYIESKPAGKQSGGTLGHHTPFDRLIRFCAEIGSPDGSDNRYQYHFQRANADSTTHDYENIPRNQELLKYLEKLTRTPIPGADGSFADKYPENERLQLLTEVFDYIRSTNLHDDTLYQRDWKSAFKEVNSNDHITYTNPRRVGQDREGKNVRTVHKGHGQVTPIRIDYGSIETKGMGRFYTLIEMGVQVICCASGGDGQGGGEFQPINPGVHEYNVGVIERPNGEQYSNFPPLPPSIQPDEEMNWPQWLKDLKMTRPDLLPIAFDPGSWNWQLAWLDTNYENAMPGAKYNRGAVSNAEDTRLGPGERCVQAALVFNMFTPSLGWVPINPDMEIDFQIEGMAFRSDGKNSSPVRFGWGEHDNGVDLSESLNPAEPGEYAWASSRMARLGEDRGWSGGDRTYGGVKPVPYFMRTSRETNESIRFQQGRTSPVDFGWAQDEKYRRYNYVTKPWKISSGKDVHMDAGVVRMNIFAAGGTAPIDGPGPTEGTASQAEKPQLVQELELEFPAFDSPPPGLAIGHMGYINEFKRVGHWRYQPMGMWSMSHDGANPHAAPAPGTVKSPNPRHPGPPWNDSMGRDGSPTGRMGRVWHLNQVFRAQDIVKSVGVRHGDARVVAARPVVRASDKLFTPHHAYNERNQKAHNFASTPGDKAPGASSDVKYNLVPQNRVDNFDRRGFYHRARRPYAMASDTADEAQRYGDFDNGMGLAIDGPYINKPDEGNVHSLSNRLDRTAEGVGMWDLRRDYGPFPYFVRDYMHEAGTPSYFSPNRIISSPGMLGSLPVGSTMPWDDQIGQPWRTLLFRPDVTGTGTNKLYDPHPGAEKPADHYFLDLMWMPVVEPYAISEPLSTAGKINMNYQILPFTNITRSTAMRGVFKSEYMLCIPNRWAWHYKVGVGRGGGPPSYHWRDRPYGGQLNTRSLRSIILEDETLEQFQERFDNNRIFRTASEICDIHLVPEEIIRRMNIGGASGSIGTYTPTVEKMADGSYWADHAVVGDNGRERPYSNIYARLTTKSNTFKVHYRAQVVQQASPPGRDYSRWNEDYDTMVAEYRGSSIVERYVEPNDPDIPDYATAISSDPDTVISATTIDEFYKYRVVNPTRFAP